jgi:hypothetical protein
LAWRGLANTAERAGDHAAARDAWQHVLALAPEGPAAEREARAHVERNQRSSPIDAPTWIDAAGTAR